MNWLLGGGGGGSEVPETPVHRWAMNAFKGAIMPDGLYGNSQLLGESPSVGNSGNSILKTPGQARDKRRVNVTFHKSVHTPPKRTSRSGLPTVFPGKFPSPWTPKIDTQQQQDLVENDIDRMNDSPISIDKDRREHSRFSNPLKVLSVKLENATNTGATSQKTARQATQPQRRQTNEGKQTLQRTRDSTRPRALSWDVDRGFDEVLASISKNNAYLQSLIDEMQESCTFANESFTEGASIADSEFTSNIDEPASSSGKYWRSKFLEFTELTQRVKSEQDNMEQALAQLRLDVQARTAEDQENWKDRYDLLKEELDKERKAARSSAHLRELRDLRRTVRDLHGKASEVEDLKKQLQIADMQIKDLEKQIDHNKTPASRVPALSRQHEPPTRPTRVFSSSPTSAEPHEASEMAPQSSTSRRLAQAKLAATSKVEPELEMFVARDTASSINVTETKSGFTQASKHRRFGSRTLTTSIHLINENIMPEKLSSSPEELAKDAKLFKITEKPVKISSTTFSPRPEFVDLDINSCDRVNVGKATPAVPIGAPIISEEAIKKREAARRRLDQRKAERLRTATKV